MLSMYMGDQNEHIPTNRPAQPEPVPPLQPTTIRMGMEHGLMGGSGSGGPWPGRAFTHFK